MKAVQFTEHGGRDVLSYDEMDEQAVTSDTVALDVKAGALNHLDVHVRGGLPGVDLSMPHVPGSDAAGIVTEIGADVTRFEEGDRVAVTASCYCGECEYCRHGQQSICESHHLLGEHVRGVHAERAVVPAQNLVPVPDGISWTVAGSVSLVFQTAWRMLMSRADLSAGERILVLGASGGVGHAAVQIADHAGAEVIATASSEEKLDHARDCGADHLIDYTDGFKDAVRELTDGRGVDVVVDHVGEATWEDSLKCLAKGGRLVTCGATTGPIAETNINRLFWNQLRIIGSTMGTPGELDDVLSKVWDGTFEPRIRTVLPMSEIATAHQMLEEREGFGKVVIIPDREYSDGGYEE